MSESAVRVDGGEASQWELRVYCKVRFVACQQSTVRVTIKFPLNARTDARFRSYRTPVSVLTVRPYP